MPVGAERAIYTPSAATFCEIVILTVAAPGRRRPAAARPARQRLTPGLLGLAIGQFRKTGKRANIGRPNEYLYSPRG
jgi:hypothetical protein